MIQSFKAVFFDAGGTLFHPYPSVGEIYAQVGAKYGCPGQAAQLEKLFREAWLRRDFSSLASRSNEKIERDWWRELVREIFSAAGGVDDFENFFDELYHCFGEAGAWRVYPGAPEVLEELKRRGKKIAVISNWDSRLFKLCEGLGMKSHFEFILASAVFGASKPSPRIFEEALRKAGIKAHEAVHIGDSVEDDVKGALGIGMKAILIDRSSEPRKHHNVPTIRSLIELLR